MGSREDNEQEMGIRKRKVPGTMEGIYSRGRYLGEQGKSQECRRISRRIQKGIWNSRRRRSQMTGK